MRHLCWRWIVAGVVLAACEDKEMQLVLPEPQILLGTSASTDITQEPGFEVRVPLTLQAVAGLADFRVTRNGDPFDEVVFATAEFTQGYELYVPIASSVPVGTVYRFDLSLRDKRGRLSTQTLTVRVNRTYLEEEVNVAGETVIRLKGRVNGDYLMRATKNYWIDSTFSIEANGKLTVEAGTQVYFRSYPSGTGVSSLVIAAGSRIEAIGTAENPIVFTSDKVLLGGAGPGDWGGIYLFGNAPTNQGPTILENGFRYGGSNLTENSGTLRYLRIEYAGKAGAHGLHLFGIGAGTTVENVQVFRCFNIAFRLKGGHVRLKRIAAIGYGGYGIWAEHGWRGQGQFWLFQTDVKATLLPVNYWNQARAVEMRNDENFFVREPRTQFQLANVTCIGNGFAENVDNGTRRGIRIRRGAVGTLQNALVTQFPDDGVRVEDLDLSELGTLMVMANQRTWNNRVDFNNEALTFFFESGAYNITKDPVAGVGLTNFVGTEVSPFNPATLSAWFEPAPYIGAVDASNDWTSIGVWFKNADGTIR